MSIPRRGVRFIDPADLVCPGCGRGVRAEPPGYWRAVDGVPAPAWSHPDGSALCQELSGAIAEPMERSQLRGEGRVPA